jgi:hypothetical protein
MKAQLSGKIVSLEKIEGDTTIVFEAKGKVDTRNIAAQPTGLHGTLTLKSMIADSMRIGAVITVTVTDEESE